MTSPMNSARAIIATTFLLAAAAVPVMAVAGPEPSQAELRAAKALDGVRGDPLALNEFLKRMPKGGELHLHLHSAVFAETLIQDAIEDELCVDVAARAFDKRQVADDGAPGCVEGTVPAASVLKDQRLYDGLIDAFSMRGFVASEGDTGHDHFFGAFTKFGGTDPTDTGAWPDQGANRAP